MSRNAAKARVDSGRLWQSLMAMAEIGATPGGGSGTSESSPPLPPPAPPWVAST